MKVRLTRLSNKENALRTDVVEGKLRSPIKRGVPLCIVAPVLGPEEGARLIVTTPVQRVKGEEVWTRNTHYRIELLSD